MQLKIGLVFFIIQASQLFGQDNPSQIRLSMNLHNVAVKEALSYIEGNYPVSFYYSDNILPQSEKNVFVFTDTPLNDALDSIFLYTDISYTLINNQIVLYKDKKKTTIYTISGFVTDSLKGESLVGVVFYNTQMQIGTVSNNYGFYSISLPEGRHTLHISYLGYRSDSITFNLKNNIRKNIKLQVSGFKVNEVEVVRQSNHKSSGSDIINITTLQMQEIREMPGLFGENNLTRSIGLLPGIHTSEFSSGNIYVRGGSADQTVFQMDEAKIYNASHFGGIFSVFNPDAINSIAVYKGELPVSGEGAISSLVDVQLKEGNNKAWKIKGSLGMISAKLLVEGPVKKNKSSVLLAMRRSYLDAILQLFPETLEPSTVNYFFYDFNLKFNSKLNKKNRVYISSYAGKDKLILYNKLIRNNQMMNFRWNHLFGAKLFSNSSIILSRNYMSQQSGISDFTTFWNRNIYNMQAKIDFSYYPSGKNRLKFGVASNSTHIFPYVIDIFEYEKASSEISGEKEYMHTTAVYMQSDYSVSPKVKIQSGIRLNHIYNPKAHLHIPSKDNYTIPTNQDQTYSTLTLEPQFFLNYKISRSLTSRAGYKRQTNSLHQLLISSTGITINRWMPASESFKPQVSNNYSISLVCDPSENFSTGFALFYRKMHNLIETLHQEAILIDSFPSKYLYRSKATAKGLELSLSYKNKRFTGKANYTYSNVKWQTSGINNDKSYNASHSRPHNLNIILSYKNNKRLSVSASWSYYSGTPYTPVLGKYILDNKEMIYFDENKINTERLPPNHRLDLSIDLAGKKNHLRKWKSYWNFSIYNVYFHRNPYSIVYFTPIDPENSNNYSLNPKYLYFYQFVPAITYKFEF